MADMRNLQSLDLLLELYNDPRNILYEVHRSQLYTVMSKFSNECGYVLVKDGTEAVIVKERSPEALIN